MMVDEQDAFLFDVAMLIRKAHELGFKISAGEMWRTQQQQEIYFKTGRSKTMRSKHLDRLAFDLNFFLDGKVVGDKATLQTLGDWWESIGPKNRWGGNFTSFVDCPHFERNL